ncbi:hypothetical protein [Sphingobium sp. SYK-6]|nr:hypothetical protein [Sphingobium sp. SYK-6]
MTATAGTMATMAAVTAVTAMASVVGKKQRMILGEYLKQPGTLIGRR